MSTQKSSVSIQTGYFILADISGYTRFLVGNDLEHAQGVLNELLTLVMRKLSAPLQFVELEGDAVFVYAPDRKVEDSERLLTIMEACYAAFCLHVEQMARNTTCNCTACQAVPSLDLKFLAHYGRFATQRTPSGVQLVGPDVTLLHLLLKNKVIEKTGVRSYALLTDAFLQQSPMRQLQGVPAENPAAAGLVAHEEQVEPFGRIAAWVADLSACVERYRRRFRDELALPAVDMELVTPLEVPSSLAWGYITDPELRPGWQTDIRSVFSRSAGNGRTDVGWESHCDHGDFTMKHRIVDWQPFERMTMQTVSIGRTPLKPPPCQVDFVFRDGPGDTCVLTFSVRLHNAGIIDRLVFKVFKPLVRRQWRAYFSNLYSATKADLELQRGYLHNAPATE